MFQGLAGAGGNGAARKAAMDFRCWWPKRQGIRRKVASVDAPALSRLKPLVGFGNQRHRFVGASLLAKAVCLIHRFRDRRYLLLLPQGPGVTTNSVGAASAVRLTHRLRSLRQLLQGLWQPKTPIRGIKLELRRRVV